jgi:anionic cell wall polymer biosynthesis LytR-Cps2A-Psr (LCP) family protein
LTTVITVMDRDGLDERTDNIVVVQPARRRLLWVPRDLWCEEIGTRINVAFKVGGHEALLRGLASLGIPVDHSVCLPRSAVENALEGATVIVPLRAPVRLWYPLTPQGRIEDGRKPADFLPPRETLQGERIHQWLGGRYARDPTARSSDLDRIQRQQVFVRALLRQGFDFSRVFHAGKEPAISSQAALDDLRRVRRWWRFSCMDRVDDRCIDGKHVLVLLSPQPRPSRRRGRAAALIRRMTNRPNAT